MQYYSPTKLNLIGIMTFNLTILNWCHLFASHLVNNNNILHTIIIFNKSYGYLCNYNIILNLNA